MTWATQSKYLDFFCVLVSLDGAHLEHVSNIVSNIIS